MIKNIVFDLGNVLFFLDFSNTVNCLEQHLLPGCSVRDIFREVIRGREFDLFNRGKLDKKGFFRYVVQFLNRDISEKEFWHSYSDIFIPNRQLMKAVPDLKRSFRLFLLSNTDPAHMDFLYPKYRQFFDNFDDAVYSYQAGEMKPDSKIFEILCKKTGIQPRESLFTDDLEDNICTAREMGFKVFHFQNNTDEFLKYIEEMRLRTGILH